MAKKEKAPEAQQFTAEWRYSDQDNDVYTVTGSDGIRGSHTKKGLERAAEELLARGTDLAETQLKIVNAKISAIEKAGPPPAPAVDEEV